MPFEHYIQSGGKRLRCGYTTGTCAALAAAGAARLLLGGRAPESVTLTTPGGLPVTAAPRYCRMAGETACCAVEKDGGDDIDATHGALIEARVERAAQPGVVIDGGPGVGRVTKPGLDQPVGAAAINRVPRRMIEQAVRAVCDARNWDGGLRVTICVPEGAALAKKTFNPQLGIEGGISILGTSGIVEPIGAVLTILAARLIIPALPYLLSFAAGAMLYVVVEELIPEMSQGKHSDIGTIFFAVGFSVMMTLDVALG